MPRTKAQPQGFEESLGALEKIVTQLEAGELPLERALELFEEGVGLARRCQSQLGEAERKVESLLREHGELKVVPFDSTRAEQPFADSGTSSPRIRRVTETASKPRAASEFEEDEPDEFDETVGDDFDDDEDVSF